MVDVRSTGPGQSGIGRYALNLWLSVERILGPQATFALTTPEVARAGTGTQGRFVPLAKTQDLPDTLRDLGIDLFHSPLFMLPPIRVCAYVFTLHDVIPLSHPAYCHAAFDAFFRRHLPAALRVASHVVAVSDFSRAEASKHLSLHPSKITTVHEPVGPVFLQDIAPSESSLLKPIGRGFILSVGALDRRKNLSRLLEAYALLRSRRRDTPALVIVGGPSGDGFDIGAEIRRLRLDDIVVRLGWVPDADLVSLYRRAALLVFPSLAEGFGLPVVEAMASGTPVVASNATSLPEIAAEAALLVDPHSVDAIADAIERVLDDRTLSESLRAAGLSRVRAFTIAEHGKALVSLYRRVLERSA